MAEIDVFIAGTGPVGATYARIILDAQPNARVTMADVGSQDSSIIGAHHKNSIKYQKDIDQFVNVIKGALQPISVPPQDTLISNLGGQGWRPPATGTLIFQGNNPNQRPDLNLKASGVTRTVGGMGTHWTCNCPIPHEAERRNNPIPWAELEPLLIEAGILLNVNPNEFDRSVRQITVRRALQGIAGRVQNMQLAVKRRADNPRYVTWTGSNTVLRNVIHSPNFRLLTEHLVTHVVLDPNNPNRVLGVEIRDLNSGIRMGLKAKVVVLCCGAVPTPQILFNSGIRPPALGRYLSEQSLAFCQIVLKREYIDAIPRAEPFGIYEPVKESILKHRRKYPHDPLAIPFADPEPQLMLPYSTQHPWHVQIHRDAFSYGDVGPRADSRVIVDIRHFGAQEINHENRVTFGLPGPLGDWEPGALDIYGMPQPTFYVQRSQRDDENDQRMMADLTSVANILGSYLPGSYPQFMEPGLALHITGTTRIGTNPGTSVADAHSRVHNMQNLWVGGNGCIPDATACNPTRTSVAIAIRGARAVLAHLWPPVAGQDAE